jgi:hypothetical protein
MKPSPGSEPQTKMATGATIGTRMMQPKDVWLDEKNMIAGQRISSSVEAITENDKILLCASRSSLTSWWVENEINSTIAKERALWKETGSEHLVLIPLNLDNYMFSGEWQSGWKNQIVSRLAPDFSKWSTEDGKSDELQSTSPSRHALVLVLRALIFDANAAENRFAR